MVDIGCEDWQFTATGNFILIVIFIVTKLLPLKEMLFKEGLGVSLHAVLRFASSEVVGDLYLVLPSCIVSLRN